MLFESDEMNELAIGAGLTVAAALACGVYYCYRKVTTQIVLKTSHDILIEGLRAFEAGNDERALDCFHVLHSEDPDNISACFNLGLQYMRMNQHAVAEEYFQSILRKDDKHIPTLFCLELMISHTDKKGKSVSRLSKMNTEVTFDNLWTSFYIAHYNKSESDFKFIINSIEADDASGKDKKFINDLLLPHAKFGLAQCYREHGQHQDALDLYQEINKSHPNFRDILTGERVDSYIQNNMAAKQKCSS